MKHTSLATAITLALTATSAFAEPAQSDEKSIEKIVVVSSRVAMPLREVATSVSLVTQADIEARGYANLAEVLKTQPAISMTSSGGAGSSTSLRVRGEEGYRTLVRIDGVDISDPTGTQVEPKLGHMQASNISRVEILRGSQGLAYGADAGGVINVHSAEYTEQLAGRVSAEAGRYDSTNLVGDIGGRTDKFSYYIAGSSFQTDGFDARTDDASGDLDGYENNTIHTRLGYQVSEQLSLKLVARNTQGEGEFDHCGFGATASDDCQSEFAQTNLRTSVNYVTGSSEHEFSYAKTLIERENFNQNVSSYLAKGATEKVEYLAHSELNDTHTLVYGADWEKEAITSAQQYRHNRGAFVEYQSELVSNLFVTAGLRYDDNDDFGEHTTYRVSSAYIWAIDSNELKLRGAYGTGFRAPSLFEVNYNRRPEALPSAANTPLKEEQTQGYEIGIEFLTETDSRFEVVYFDQEIEDSITYTFDSVTYADGYIQDIGQSESKGVELIAEIKLGKGWSVDANYTYNEAEDTAGNQRRRRPRNIANLGANYQLDKLTFTANIRVIKDAVDAGVPLENYEILDISAKYQVNPQLSVYARVENLFDAHYQDISDYNTSGESPYLGLRYQF
ncbi:TonB-dependent siderophore receptor [Paraglaciecola sp. L3A3]|uniref:TonB-dependent receptor plug domain-containing protein n=1 Tax=Paraglaciecola sp. L3A3 TaxID=2686358 RepID=UPI00131C9849|nr:TonB-dependent receptor [Paraglaciecola sp. L3A3]